MFRLIVFRPIKTGPKAGQLRSEWLKGDTSRDEVAAEAWALLEDPKDTISCVKVFHMGWGQFMPMTFEQGWSHDGSHKLKDGEVDAWTTT